MTALLQAHAQAAAGPKVQVRAVTAPFGAPYIVDEATYAVAAHATLDAWQSSAAQGQPDAVLVGCFGDPGLFALREVAGVPVTGLAEGAFVAARRHGRFAVVTGGARWGPMLERLALVLGHGDMLAGIHTVGPSGAQLAANPELARTVLAQACGEAVRRFEARSVIIGGAGLAGMAARLQPQVEVPLIDSVAAGTLHALELCA